MKQRLAIIACFLPIFCSSCEPPFEQRASLVTTPRILGVRAEPPESVPGQNVTYEALLANPDGPFVPETLQWAFCAAPKALTENNAVSAACLKDAVRPIDGNSLTISVNTPMDACQLFGPETPPGDFRPRDADDTGGYYQPLRLEALDQTLFAFERITCNLANAPFDVAVQFSQQYVPNRNPVVNAWRVLVHDENVEMDVVPVSSKVGFEVDWLAEDAESFVVFDPARQALVWRRETLRVSWYATRGVFEHDVTGRDEMDDELTTRNEWLAPDEPADVTIWIVLRDSRGGMDFRVRTLTTKR
jgi:hypothetical protein